jgi:hypothetical protein
MCDTEACLCEIAVASFYRRLREQGVPERVALVGAASIYDQYHPGATTYEAMNAVQRAVTDEPPVSEPGRKRSE